MVPAFSGRSAARAAGLARLKAARTLARTKETGTRCDARVLVAECQLCDTSRRGGPPRNFFVRWDARHTVHLSRLRERNVGRRLRDRRRRTRIVGRREVRIEPDHRNGQRRNEGEPRNRGNFHGTGIT